MGVLRDVLGALGGDHRLLGKLQDGVSIAQYKNIPDQVLEGLYAQGYGHYQSGNIQDAHNLFLYLCFHDHTNARFLAAFGAACFKMGKIEQAAQVLQSALELSPTDPGPALNLAQALEKLGQTDKAKEALLHVCAVAKGNNNYKPFEKIAEGMLERLPSTEVVQGGKG